MYCKIIFRYLAMEFCYLAEEQTIFDQFSSLIQHPILTLWHHSGPTMIYVHQEKCPMKYIMSAQDL